MNKKKRFINGFTNWLFEEYKVPRIPVKVMYRCDAIVDGSEKCNGYFGWDNGEMVILVAAKRLGLTKCLFVIAHEFVHYMQYLNHRNMEETEIIEEDAYYYEMPLVGKYLWNKRKRGTKITGVLDVAVPIRLARRELPNDDLLLYVASIQFDALVVEMVGHYGKGMPAGKTVFDTCVWIGRFIQEAAQRKIPAYTIMRGEEKINLCGSAQAKDANIRQALIDRFARTSNGKGTKKEPDFFYGFAADAWQAYACGVTWMDKQKEGQKGAKHE